MENDTMTITRVQHNSLKELKWSTVTSKKSELDGDTMGQNRWVIIPRGRVSNCSL